MIYVCAGNKQQYEHWLKENGCKKNRAVFLTKAEQLEGVSQPNCVFYGTPYVNKGYTEIRDLYDKLWAKPKKREN